MELNGQFKFTMWRHLVHVAKWSIYATVAWIALCLVIYQHNNIEEAFIKLPKQIYGQLSQHQCQNNSDVHRDSLMKQNYCQRKYLIDRVKYCNCPLATRNQESFNKTMVIKYLGDSRVRYVNKY